jgi:NitT/TauT family transport system substrate-binding protein
MGGSAAGSWVRRDRSLGARTRAGVLLGAVSVLLVLLATLLPTVPAAASGDLPTRDEVTGFVARAVAYAREHGRDAALAAYTDPDGGFVDGQLYIYAYDFDGTVLAHGGDPGLVGRNLIDLTDTNGVHVIRELARIARSDAGSGWLHYTWPDPLNGDLPASKVGYVERVDDTWFLGSGAFGPAVAASALRVKLKWYDQAQFAGWYAAQDQGYFGSHGLAVTTMPAVATSNPIDAIVVGDADVAQASMDQAQARSTDGRRFVNIAQIFQRPATQLICRIEPGLISVQDLQRRTVAASEGDRGVVKAIYGALFGPGIEPTFVEPGPDIESLTSGAADCLWASSFIEGYQVQDAQLQAFSVRPGDLGIDRLEDGLYVDEARLADPAFRSSLVALLRGLEQGWRWVRDNPTAASALVVQRHPGLDPLSQRRELEAVLELLGSRFGYLDLEPYSTTDALGIQAPGPVLAGGLWTHRIWNEAQASKGSSAVITPVTESALQSIRSSPVYVLLLGLGTFAAAVSGALLGLRVGYRIWGMFVLAGLTAVGGGIIRDVLLGGVRYPIWLVDNPLDIGIIAAGVALVWAMAHLGPTRAILHTDRFAENADVIGFSIIAINGALIALIAHAAIIWVPIAAALSVAGGGILSDVLVNREHQGFRGAIYDEIAVVGSGILLVGLLLADRVEHRPEMVLAAVAITLILLLAMRFAVLHYGLRYPRSRFVGQAWDEPATPAEPPSGTESTPATGGAPA